MYTKWLAAVLASIGLVLVSSQTNVTEVDTNSTTVTPNVTTPTAPPTTTKLPITTTASPTPTPQPTVPPKPEPESWNGTVSYNKTVCLSAKFSVWIDITYNTTNNTLQSTGFIIPTTATIDESNSYCNFNDSLPEALAIKFVNEQHTSANLSLLFNNTDNDVRVHTIKLSFNLTRDLFPDFKQPSLYGTSVSLEKTDLTLFKVASAHSYLCNAGQSADLGGSIDKFIDDVTIQFSDSEVEAYIPESQKGKVNSAIDCKSSEISDVVPIAVGAALAGLVVIVLIAYFIGRRRSRRLAYQSV